MPPRGVAARPARFYNHEKPGVSPREVRSALPPLLRLRRERRRAPGALPRGAPAPRPRGEGAGELLMGGAFADPVDGACCSSGGRPVGRRGLRPPRSLRDQRVVTRWRIRAWTWSSTADRLPDRGCTRASSSGTIVVTQSNNPTRQASGRTLGGWTREQEDDRRRGGHWRAGGGLVRPSSPTREAVHRTGGHAQDRLRQGARARRGGAEVVAGDADDPASSNVLSRVPTAYSQSRISGSTSRASES